MKFAYIIISLVMLSACVPVREASTIQTLEAFDSAEHFEEFAQQRRLAIERLVPHPTKSSFGLSSILLNSWKRKNPRLEEVTITGLRSSPTSEITESDPLLPDHSITNNQEKHVDEGGIVKRLGDHMIVLRRGILYTCTSARPSQKAMKFQYSKITGNTMPGMTKF